MHFQIAASWCWNDFGSVLLAVGFPGVLFYLCLRNSWVQIRSRRDGSMERSGSEDRPQEGSPGDSCPSPSFSSGSLFCCSSQDLRVSSRRAGIFGFVYLCIPSHDFGGWDDWENSGRKNKRQFRLWIEVRWCFLTWALLTEMEMGRAWGHSIRSRRWLGI